MQAALLDSMYGTERGLAARSEVRAEINELITQLEAKNPTPSPTDVSQCRCLLISVQKGLRQYCRYSVLSRQAFCAERLETVMQLCCAQQTGS